MGIVLTIALRVDKVARHVETISKELKAMQIIQIASDDNTINLVMLYVIFIFKLAILTKRFTLAQVSVNLQKLDYANYTKNRYCITDIGGDCLTL